MKQIDLGGVKRTDGLQTNMHNQDDSELWQLLGKASQPTPGKNFTDDVMAHISSLEQERSTSPSFRFFRGHRIRTALIGSGTAIAAAIAVMLSLTPTPSTPDSTVLLNIDDILVEEAGESLGQENVWNAICVLSSDQAQDLYTDGVQDLIL